MITFTKGDILKADTEALVNTVGVMGKGIAIAFKKAYPANFKVYRKAFEEEKLTTGKMLVYPTGLLLPKFIINFPTKKHWRHKSKIEYIDHGLQDLVDVIKQEKIQSIAIPPLGCGDGGLDWVVVKPKIVQALESIDHVDIRIYEPGFQSNIKPVRTITELNPTRAIYLWIMRQYESLGEEITTLVVQKLAYLLQKSGEPLRLRFEKGYYGPYAQNLSKMIQALSPHYLSYEGDLNKPATVIRLNQAKKAETKAIIDHQLSPDQRSRLDYVQRLIEGFEHGFGLELLATVSYALEDCSECTEAELINKIQKWTKRKKELMSEHMIRVSLERLKAFELNGKSKMEFKSPY